MAESDKPMRPHTDALLRDNVVVIAAAESAPLDCVEEPQREPCEGHDDQDGGTLLELFSLIADVEAVAGDEDASPDTPVGVIGEKRVTSTPASAADSPAARAPQATTRKTKKRRYQEVLRLRGSAAELEQELDALKSRQTRAEHLVRDAGVFKWQREATTEIQATARARLENTKLKRNLDAQVAFVKAFQDALRKRQDAREELQHALLGRQTTMGTVARPCDPKESEIYALLIKSIYARVCELDEVFRANVVSNQPETTMHGSPTVLVSGNGEDALCIDLIDGYIIPFDYKAGAHVLWTHVLSKELELTGESTQTEIIVTTDDVIVTKQTTNANFMIQDHELTTEYSISKRVCDKNCVSFLWESITESKGSLARSSSLGTPPIKMIQKGCVKVKHLATANGARAASLLAYVRLTPSTIPDERSESGTKSRQLRQQFDVRVLTAHIVVSYRQHAEAIRRFLENTLLDEMLTAANPAQRCSQ